MARRFSSAWKIASNLAALCRSKTRTSECNGGFHLMSTNELHRCSKIFSQLEEQLTLETRDHRDDLGEASVNLQREQEDLGIQSQKGILEVVIVLRRLYSDEWLLAAKT
ncbi:hypothetical protein LTR17_026751 [Elasticomyces elasticus]|nr:hypothetical protein LTR17_026751 [Elasticomyces elasticus]